MRTLAVVPFAADDVDPDANDLSRWLGPETGAELSAPGVLEARLVVDPVEISAEALGAAASQLGVELALGASLRLADGQVEVAALLVDARGQVRSGWAESLPLGGATQLPRMLARAVLLALGEDASAPPQSVEVEAPADAVLRLCRAARRLGDGEVDEGAEELLALSAGLPAARRALLSAAREALGTDRMPAFFSALERLGEAHGDDAEVLLALADYRAAHLDAAGARELYLRARDCAEDPALSARASGQAAALAEAAGRNDEAVLHLRAAVRLLDDADLYARLGALLLPKSPAEGLQMLARAAVLAPQDAALHLRLARSLREHGEPARALSAAARAADLCRDDPGLAAEVRAELESLLGA